MPENAEKLGQRVTVMALAVVGIVVGSLSLLQYVPLALMTYVSVNSQSYQAVAPGRASEAEWSNLLLCVMIAQALLSLILLASSSATLCRRPWAPPLMRGWAWVALAMVALELIGSLYLNWNFPFRRNDLSLRPAIAVMLCACESILPIWLLTALKPQTVRAYLAPPANRLRPPTAVLALAIAGIAWSALWLMEATYNLCFIMHEPFGMWGGAPFTGSLYARQFRDAYWQNCTVINGLLTLGLAIWLLAASVGALMLRRWSRWGLISWAGCTIALMSAGIYITAYLPPSPNTPALLPWYPLVEMIGSINSLISAVGARLAGAEPPAAAGAPQNVLGFLPFGSAYYGAMFLIQPLLILGCMFQSYIKDSFVSPTPHDSPPGEPTISEAAFGGAIPYHRVRPDAPPRRNPALSALAIIAIAWGAYGLIVPLNRVSFMIEYEPYVHGPHKPLLIAFLDSGWDFVRCVVGGGLAGLLLAAAIGILRRKPWADRVMIGWAGATCIWAVVEAIELYLRRNMLAYHSPIRPRLAAFRQMPMLDAAWPIVFELTLAIAMLVLLWPSVRAWLSAVSRLKEEY